MDLFDGLGRITINSGACVVGYMADFVKYAYKPSTEH